MWEDNDRRPYSPAPAARFAPYLWDAMDHMVFRPMSDAWSFEPQREAINVNALDEVPDSSWYANRIARRPMSAEEVARGACEAEMSVPAPWQVFAGKPNGATPGFLFEDAAGQRYVLKVDRVSQPEQATAADAIVASLYHAAGYYVPCNRVVGFTEDMLVLREGAMVERTYESDLPMTWEHVYAVIRAAQRFPDGQYRAVVSRFVEGDSLGPWSYLGVHEGDPNDAVPHEHRRELRGMFVLNAWANHWDSREHNTLATWMATGSRGYVRHYLLDFGDSLGYVEGDLRRARRFGHSQWFDAQHIVEDALGFGIIRRPWDDGERGPAGRVLGFYDVERFTPDEWRPDYWNGAFDRRTERDMAWMARIIARFDREHLRAIARLGRFSDPLVERELVRVMAGRRRAILERYLTRLSPLADPELRAGGAEVCMTDLTVAARLRWAEDRGYEARVHSGAALEVYREDERGRVCVELPAAAASGEYLVVDVVSVSSGRERNAPLRLHFVRGAAGLTIVGLERPERQMR